MKPGSVVIALATLGIMAATARCLAAEVPPGFVAEKLATRLNAATAIAPAADGRIFIADQTGPLRVWKHGSVLAEPTLDLSARLDTHWERGLIGVTLHPDFPRTPHLFVLYVAKAPFTHHVVSRFTVTGDIADPASEEILLRGDDQKSFGGSQPAGHQGGPLRFGPDGRLYVAIGEQTSREPAQRLDTLLGKILRLNPDGTIPEDNPFFTRTTGKYRGIWAVGLRNPFGLAFQPETARLFASDAGQTSWEEINEIVRGANYGWPAAEGVSAEAEFTNPLHAYPPAIGRSVVGAAFYPRSAGSGQAKAAGWFPPAWHGMFFFADWAANWVKALDPDAPAKVVGFARGLSNPVALEVAPDGSLLVLERGTIWIDGAKFASNAGSLTRIRYVGEPAVVSEAALPTLLSTAGVFRNLAAAEPAAGFLPFELNAPLWLPGLRVRRWISMPGSGEIAVAPEGGMQLPPGAVVVQHFATEDGRPFETHVYWFTAQAPRAGAYRWSRDRRDAALVRDSEIVDLPGNPPRRWHSPGAEKELNLDATVSGFVLQLSAAQLNREVSQPDALRAEKPSASHAKINQLALWSRRGWLATPLRKDDIARLPRLAALDDAASPVELRVRSYLDGNCASCHRPGGLSRAAFDLRATIPLARASLIGAAPIAGDLGIAGAQIVAPGEPEKSLLWLRLRDAGAYRMPPLRLHDEHPPVLPLVEEWIRSLP